jgi:hypothetical protein
MFPTQHTLPHSPKEAKLDENHGKLDLLKVQMEMKSLVLNFVIMAVVF